MRVIVTAVLCTLLSGCAINWPTKVSQPQFSWSSNPSGPAADPATQERAQRPRPKAEM